MQHPQARFSVGFQKPLKTKKIYIYILRHGSYIGEMELSSNFLQKAEEKYRSFRLTHLFKHKFPALK